MIAKDLGYFMGFILILHVPPPPLQQNFPFPSQSSSLIYLTCNHSPLTKFGSALSICNLTSLTEFGSNSSRLQPLPSYRVQIWSNQHSQLGSRQWPLFWSQICPCPSIHFEDFILNSHLMCNLIPLWSSLILVPFATSSLVPSRTILVSFLAILILKYL